MLITAHIYKLQQRQLRKKREKHSSADQNSGDNPAEDEVSAQPPTTRVSHGFIDAATFYAANTAHTADGDFYTRAPFPSSLDWDVRPGDCARTAAMLLLHQVGSLRVGDVVRYTLTYTPSADVLQQLPNELCVRVRNTSAVALRAAYIRGPYTIHASCYPRAFNPHAQTKEDVCGGVRGDPQFEPNLKAGASWDAVIPVSPLENMTTPGSGTQTPTGQSFTWVIELASQIIFSRSAEVHFEVLVARDRAALDYGVAHRAARLAPGHVRDFVRSGHKRRHVLPEVLHGHQHGNLSASLGGTARAQPGVFSPAIGLDVDDTATLWNMPRFPSFVEKAHAVWEERPRLDVDTVVPGVYFAQHTNGESDEQSKDKGKGKLTGEGLQVQKQKQKKIHFVVLTHGLHSNLGADMLFLKESIDAAARQASQERRKQRAARRKGADKFENSTNGSPSLETADEDSDSDEEQVIVRGFPGNVARTERGIQYLGKRLAKYVLLMTYPDQPYLPIKATRSFHPFRRRSDAAAVHQGSTIQRQDAGPRHVGRASIEPYRTAASAYRITSISFIGHSLGGLVQTYAIAYIQKHSPDFFERIHPLNFVALASPFLGLSNENPLYVRFALDFGLVGRTGQDLGLAWRSAPSRVRSGWDAMIGGLGNSSTKASAGGRGHPHAHTRPYHDRIHDPGSKPLLRILPNGPAHDILRCFRNRTVYSNVVNDGIVPLRTSCLLFLDWRGLDRVDKARRDNGIVGRVAEWGWAEITGANATEVVRAKEENNNRAEKEKEREDRDGDQPWIDENDNAVDEPDAPPTSQQHLNTQTPTQRSRSNSPRGSPLSSFLAFFRPESHKEKDKNEGSHHGHSHHNPPQLSKNKKIYHRSQTLSVSADDSNLVGSSAPSFPSPQSANSRSSSPAISPSRALPRAQTLPSTILTAPDQGLNQDCTVFSSSSLAPTTTKSAVPPAPSAPDSSNNPPTQFDSNLPSFHTPPTTSILEAAGDIINPPLPQRRFLIDPQSRPRTIFHDRVYHPTDIPPAEMAAAQTIDFSSLAHGTGSPGHGNAKSSHDTGDSGGASGTMKVEEKIARAYHRDLSWRKVLVRLEPDAHNNIVVRRMFANAYGWPVVKHLVDTHFGATYEAMTADDAEGSAEHVVLNGDGDGRKGHVSDGEKGKEVKAGSGDAEAGEEPRGRDLDARRTDGTTSASTSLTPRPHIQQQSTGPQQLPTPPSPSQCSFSVSPSRLDRGLSLTLLPPSPMDREQECQLDLANSAEAHADAEAAQQTVRPMGSAGSCSSSAQWTDRVLEDGDEDHDGYVGEEEVQDSYESDDSQDQGGHKDGQRGRTDGGMNDSGDGTVFSSIRGVR